LNDRPSDALLGARRPQRCESNARAVGSPRLLIKPLLSHR
jgi:hypothetical protein